jgi:SsrA-binding protein
MARTGERERVAISNRRARHEYFILDTYECGIMLVGSEVKSIRDGRANLQDAYARVENGELWLIGAHIAPYRHGSHANHDPDRPRKLLVHKAELRELRAAIEQKGMTLVPLRLILKQGRAKLELGVVRGKKLYDKRAATAEREARRDVERAVRDRV